MADSTTSQSAQVTWSDDVTKDTVSYYVEYRAKGNNSSLLKVVQKQRTASLAALQVNNEYEVRVRGVSAAGGGPWSEYTQLTMGRPGKWASDRTEKRPLRHNSSQVSTAIFSFVAIKIKCSRHLFLLRYILHLICSTIFLTDFR